MGKLIERFGNAIVACISGFDRLMLKGCIRPLMYADGAMKFLRHRKVLNKDYKEWVQDQSQQLITSVEHIVQEQTGRGIMPIPSSRIRKEALAHRRQAELGIDTGLIGAWSCVEAGRSYRACFDREKGFPQLRSTEVRCKHLYLYMDHEDYGFLNIRLQTWFPYQIQIALNGREWLRRQLDKADICYRRCANKFLEIANPKAAQKLLDRQAAMAWPRLLDRLVPTIFPSRPHILGNQFSYYWTIWQSEWATDLICRDQMVAQDRMDDMLRHALITGTIHGVLNDCA